MLTTIERQSLIKNLTNFLNSFIKWSAPWYGAYAILGAVTAALIPVLLPLMIMSISGNIAYVGWVMGCYNLGLLSSPLWGSLADKKHVHRSIFFGGFTALIIGMTLLPLCRSFFDFIIIALIIGAGTAAVATVATLFVVEFNPQPEWSPRIGWLQSFNGTGQTLGLFFAAFFSGNNLFNTGMWFGAALLIPAVLIGHLGLPVKKAEGHKEKIIHIIDIRRIAKFGKSEFLGGGLLRHSHHLNLAALKSVGKLISTDFGYFIFSWSIESFAVAAFFANFPIVMKSAYMVEPGLTSLIYAIAGAIGIVLFTGTTRLSSRFGVKKVFRYGIIVRLTGFLLLLIMIYVRTSISPLIASAGFILIVLAWPIISVTSTTLTAELTPISEGEAMGLYNASGAVATVVGTFLGGPLVNIIGYSAIPMIGSAGLIIALIFTSKIKK